MKREIDNESLYIKTLLAIMMFISFAVAYFNNFSNLIYTFLLYIDIAIIVLSVSYLTIKRKFKEVEKECF